LLFCFVESALKNFPGTEADVTKALSSLLKYAPDVLSHEMKIQSIIVQTVNCDVNNLVCSFYFLTVLVPDAKCKF